MVPHADRTNVKGGRKSFNGACTFCKRVFTKKEHLQRHLRCHTQERPFRCRQCGKSYPRNDTLRRHERTHSELEGAPAITTDFDRNVDSLTAGQRDHSNDIRRNQALPLVEESPTTSIPDYYSLRQESAVAHHGSTAQTRGRLPVNKDSAVLGLIGNETNPTSNVLQGSYHDTFTIESAPVGDLNFEDDSWLLSSDFDVAALELNLHETLIDWAHVSPFNLTGMGRSTDSETGVLEPTVLSSSAVPSFQVPGQSEHRRPSEQQQHGDPALTQPGGRGTEPPRQGIRQTIPAGRPAMFRIDMPSLDGWYSRLQPEEGLPRGEMASRAVSEDHDQEVIIDEQYTAALSEQLRPRQYNEMKLSVTYLNMCLRLYHTRFHPVFPVVHMPSFRPDSRNALLLLSMCSIGSLFVGTPDAIAQGHHIYSRVNKVVLASWETYLSGTAHQSLSVIQAALIGQTFGLLSSRSNHLNVTDAFQGTMISWARRVGCFDKNKFLVPSAGLQPGEIKQAWKDWVYNEQIRRVLLGIYIHDAELSCLFHREPLLRHASAEYVWPVNDTLFRAPTAEQWWNLIHTFRAPLEKGRSMRMRDWTGTAKLLVQEQRLSFLHHSRFAAYATLENICAIIIEARCLDQLSQEKCAHICEDLTLWYTVFLRSNQSDVADLLALRVLWHSCFMILSTDFSLLEGVLGRYGQLQKKASIAPLIKWIPSTHAIRCLLHASAIKELIESTPMAATLAVHLPRALFEAGLAWVCYLRWRQMYGRPEMRAHQALIAEVKSLSEVSDHDMMPQHHLAEVLSLPMRNSTVHQWMIVYETIGLLQRLGGWEVSQTFANILKDASQETFQ